MLLVPGWMQSAADYRQAGYVDRLAANRRVLIVDSLGHGQSDKPHEAAAYRTPDVAADVIAVLDAAGLERAALWGYSRGAWRLAGRESEFPERLSALILEEQAGPQPPPTELPAWVEPLSMVTGCFGVVPDSEEAGVMRDFEKPTIPGSRSERSPHGERVRYVFDLRRVSTRLGVCGGRTTPTNAVPPRQGLRHRVTRGGGSRSTSGINAVDSVMQFAMTSWTRLPQRMVPSR